MNRRVIVAVVVAPLLAVATASAFDDALGINDFATSRARAALGIVTCAALAASLSAGATDASIRARTATAAAILAAAVSFILVRGPWPWVDLGPFGAGPLGAVAVIHMPVAVATAIALGNVITRGASRTPPWSRPPSRPR